MFEIAKYRIAMGNAEPEIKDLSSFITKRNDEDGLPWQFEKC
ncbi:HAD hydrolase family protein [Halalkalibacter alkalisediminis]